MFDHFRPRVVAVVAMAAFSVAIFAGSARASEPSPRVPDARPCLHTGWLASYRTDGSTFGSPGACVSYVVQGGALSYLRATFTYPDLTYPDPTSPDTTYFRSEGSGSGLLPGSGVAMWARFAPATISPWLGELAGQTTQVNGGTVEADGSTIRPDTAAPTFFGNYLRCSGPIGPFPGQLWDQIWATGVSAGGAAISSPVYTYGSDDGLPC